MINQNEPRRLLRIGEAAIYSATSRATLYVEWKKGNLQFIKLGHATRVEIAELDRWINEKAGVA